MFKIIKIQRLKWTHQCSLLGLLQLQLINQSDICCRKARSHTITGFDSFPTILHEGSPVTVCLFWIQFMMDSDFEQGQDTFINNVQHHGGLANKMILKDELQQCHGGRQLGQVAGGRVHPVQVASSPKTTQLKKLCSCTSQLLTVSYNLHLFCSETFCSSCFRNKLFIPSIHLQARSYPGKQCNVKSQSINVCLVKSKLSHCCPGAVD